MVTLDTLTDALLEQLLDYAKDVRDEPLRNACIAALHGPALGRPRVAGWAQHEARMHCVDAANDPKIAGYLRISAGLREVARDAESPDGWMKRVLAAIDAEKKK